MSVLCIIWSSKRRALVVKKKEYALTLLITDLMNTIEKIASFFEHKKIMVERTELCRIKNSDALLVVKCYRRKNKLSILLIFWIELMGC
jgi:hypothetical protein